MLNVNILAIETSCDDTGVALICNGLIKKNIIISSASIQNTYGGVVPEIAARCHEQNIVKAVIQAIDEFDLKQLNYIAYTANPGLRVCLNIGEICATTLSSMLKIPVIGINHIYAHIFSFHTNPNIIIRYPFISLVASGGHTSIFLVKSPIDIEVLNETCDDAAGECYDKVARELKLGYPGGPHIDNLYDESKADKIQFLKKMPSPGAEFSFSGLKTSVLNYLNQQKMQKLEIDISAVASSFQKTLISLIITKLNYYVNLHHVFAISIGGGVACNKYLQQCIHHTFADLIIYQPESNIMTGDNAAMIGIYANLCLKHKLNK